MYKPAELSIWKGRKSAGSFHIFEIIESLDLTDSIWTPTKTKNFAILGFGCDEGVRRNRGRVGARNAPDLIKKKLSGLAIHFDPEDVGLMDAGNVICSTQNLEGVSQLLTAKVKGLLDNEYFPIVLGGGHETAYPHYVALRQYLGNTAKIGIVNLDAHLDMRPYPNGQHSGSPFRQILDESLLAGYEFHYLPIGIRMEANSSQMVRIFKDSGQKLICLSEMQEDFGSVLQQVLKFTEAMDAIYLTIDMDGFPAAFAPGVSASAADGFFPHHAKGIIKLLATSGKLSSIDIVETNPEFDKDDVTAKLAAGLVYHLIEKMV